MKAHEKLLLSSWLRHLEGILCSIEISFDVFLSLNCTVLYKRGGGAWKPDSYFQILEVRFRSVHPASLTIHRKWLLHHQKVTRYSCNLNIGMAHKHTVQTQIRLLHLIRVCTISYSAVLNKHKRKFGDDLMLKLLSIHFVSRSYCSI